MPSKQYRNRLSASLIALSAVVTSMVLFACAPAQNSESTIHSVPLIVPAENKAELMPGTVQQQPASNAPHKTRVKTADTASPLQKRPVASGRPMLADESVAYSQSYGTVFSLQSIRNPSEPVNRENYAHFDDNSIKLVAESPVSTFSIDVDTGSYSNVRRMLNSGQLPVGDAVRVEELVNYFSYDYPMPNNSNLPFSITTEVSVTPWNPDTLLMHIGIKGYDITNESMPPSNLVFLVDVSGSMNSPNKLGLLKSALKLLSRQMRDEDRISIVVYAGASGVVLDPVAGTESARISQALDSLTAGGRTNGAAGIRTAYQLAEQSFIKHGINRVLLATDGDFNVGTVSFEALKDLVEEKRKSGISLTTLGFGAGNYNDHLMEQLADAGNGNYAYIDTLNEAQKVLVDEMSSTLNTIAKDVKIQLEFNPAVVAEYRLIGYENRGLKREDFNNDKIDAGEIGAGHTVTALYEITLHNSKGKLVDPLRYAEKPPVAMEHSDELALLRIRYKQPANNTSKLIEQTVQTSRIIDNLADSSDRFRFSASVAGFGQLLRGGKYTGKMKYDDILELARNARGTDAFGYRGEFISLVNLAGSLQTSIPANKVQASR